MMSTAENQEWSEWSTSNLALVTYLVLQDHDILRNEWQEIYPGRKSCVWLFEESDELADDVADFEGGVATVDPKTFNYVYGKLKRDMLASR